MHIRLSLGVAAVVALLGTGVIAQTHGQPEDFTAIAIANDNLGAGAGTVQISVDRWSTEAEQKKLVTTLREKGPRAMLDVLQDMPRAGFIRTPDSLGYPLHFAHQTEAPDGGRRIIIATDRPIGFWELWHGTRSADYPFTVIQMQIGRDGRGTGSMSVATRILAYGDIIELENFTSAPVMLKDIRAVKDDE
jgi:hypothetical protein